MAEGVLNGPSLGIAWTPPFRVGLGEALKAGVNESKVEATNLWANRLIGEARHSPEETRDRANTKAGAESPDQCLLDPVGLVAE